MDKLDELIIHLQRIGYRTQTLRDEIVLEFDAHSKLRGSREQIEKILPALIKGGRSRLAAAKIRSKKSKTSHSKKRRKRRTGKEIVTSAQVPTLSVETQESTTWRKSKSQGGLPGLGKRR